MKAFTIIGIALAVAGCPTVQRHGLDEATRPGVAPEPVPSVRAIAVTTPDAPAAPHAAPEPTPQAPTALPQAAATPPGATLLDPLHPELRTRALLLYQRAAERGIAFRFIHGFAPYKARRTMGPGGMANWHNFGLAFDLNLAHRTSLGDAKAHFEEDAAIWQALGAIAADIGLVWGGSWRSSYDPFHFEWHPGHDSVINREDLKAFLKVAGKGARRWRAVWRLFPGAESLPPEAMVADDTVQDSAADAVTKPGKPLITKRKAPPRRPRPPRRR